MEAGPVSAKIKGSSRFVFFTVTGFDFDGGHLEDQGISPTGELVDVPQYRHEISVDFTRIELEYDYTFKENWDIRFRLPYEIKRRKAGIEIPESASTAQQEAIKRSSEIHHDSETLTGLSDIKLIFPTAS